MFFDCCNCGNSIDFTEIMDTIHVCIMLFFGTIILGLMMKYGVIGKKKEKKESDK